MADVLRQLLRRVTSATGATATSDWVHVGGNPFEFRFNHPGSAHTATAPAVTLQGSTDKFNAVTLHQEGGPATTTTQIDNAAESGYQAVLERPKWSRFAVAADAEGSRVYEGVFIIHKEE